MNRIVRCATLVFALAAIPATASAQSFELEANVAGGTSAWMFGSYEPGIRVGVALMEDLVLATGLSGHISSEDATPSVGGVSLPFADRNSWGITVPLEAKFYVTPATAGSVSPTVRVGAAYAQTSIQDCCTSRRFSFQTLVGAQYFVDDHVGLSVEGGPELSHSVSEVQDGGRAQDTALNMIWRGSLVLRI